MNKEIENEKYLEFLCNLAPMLQKLIPLDCIIGIADTEKILQSLPGKNISLPTNNAGVILPKEAPITRAIKENKPVKVITPASVFGLEYQGTAIPIHDLEGNVIGGMGLGVGLEKKEIVSKNANQVADSSEFVRKNVEDLFTSAEELYGKQQKLLELTHTITTQINETEKIIQMITKISNTSKILGLNASIEASRSGEMGKGFGVVASEIRKMAEDSTKAVFEVSNMLNGIKEKIIQIDIEVNQTTLIGNTQALATKELSNTVIELSETAKILQDASKDIVG